MENRRNALRLRSRMDDLLETLALLEALPSRRADDPALQAAVREARPYIAQIVAVLDRMEQDGLRAAGTVPGAALPTSGEGAADGDPPPHA